MNWNPFTQGLPFPWLCAFRASASFFEHTVENLPSPRASLADWAAHILLACLYWINGKLNWGSICHIMKAFFGYFIYYSPNEWYHLLPAVRNCFICFHFMVSGTWCCLTAALGWQEGAYIGSEVSVLRRAQNLESGYVPYITHLLSTYCMPRAPLCAGNEKFNGNKQLYCTTGWWERHGKIDR